MLTIPGVPGAAGGLSRRVSLLCPVLPLLSSALGTAIPWAHGKGGTFVSLMMQKQLCKGISGFLPFFLLLFCYVLCILIRVQSMKVRLGWSPLWFFWGLKRIEMWKIFWGWPLKTIKMRRKIVFISHCAGWAVPLKPRATPGGCASTFGVGFMAAGKAQL